MAHVLPMTIGRLARAAGVHVETVRYYQRIGLVPAPPRPTGGIRHYPPETVDRIRFIRRAQRLGFTLQEVAELLTLGTGRCQDVRRRAAARRDQIDAQIQDLRGMCDALDALIRACRSGRRRHCPIVEALTGHRDR
ncbi:MAG: MerR family transcriptional regulator [Gammaproteobacteria bacterium]|nr:MerR family DNA-binding protein [Gammaproteobacteria bacterium]